MTPSSMPDPDFFSSDRGRAMLERFDRQSTPRHVAIIMDGNGRWAASRGLPRLAGHRAGAQAIREAIAASIELGVEVLTIYSFSSENWNRPTDEVSGLMNLFVEVLGRELENLGKTGVQVRVIGDMSAIPRSTVEAFDRTERATADNTNLTLVVALNYGGRNEILRAARSLAEDVRAGRIDPDAIGEADLEGRLYTAGLPDPDLMIRTSGEFRVSNFLLWQIAYAELFITDVLWPDFDRDSLLEAVIEYQSRDRRFGGR